MILVEFLNLLQTDIEGLHYITKRNVETKMKFSPNDDHGNSFIFEKHIHLTILRDSRFRYD